MSWNTLSRIAGREITHVVVKSLWGDLRIVSAEYSRRPGEIVCRRGTRKQCEWYIHSIQ